MFKSFLKRALAARRRKLLGPEANGFTLVELMVVIFIIGLLATVVIINVLPSQDRAMVTKAQADIAILRTMGATPRTIMGIFMVQGLSIGVVGVLLGTTLGIIGALTISDLIAALERLFQFQILNADVYFISYLPSQLKLSDVLIVVSASLTISFLATLYPSYRASRVQPAEALRYE